MNFGKQSEQGSWLFCLESPANFACMTQSLTSDVQVM